MLCAGLGLTFAKPCPMSEADIHHAIHQFTYAAGQVQKAGFTGIQLHGAHGYLISQFLSPLTNRRTDAWGGNLENRARFLMELIRGIRKVVGPTFPLSLKLNSSDFQKGGFTHAQCLELVAMINNTPLDLIELSGGSLEQPKVVGMTLKDEGEDKIKESTKKREAYFIEFAGAVRKIARMPVMVTGGFRSVEGMLFALEHGELDVVGLGRPLLVDPQTPAKILSGEMKVAPTMETQLVMMEQLSWFNVQIERIAGGLQPDLRIGGPESLTYFMPLESKNFRDLLLYRLRTEFSPRLLLHVCRQLLGGKK
jgi:2,4-dienoyl-CoA reductase-like NADH-dependent reductase (Old Yellow Enzyme family)